jgi:hypothetical protein
MALVKLNNRGVKDISSLSSLTSSLGDLTFISKQTASSSASISFTSGIDSTYKEYIFFFNNIHPATDNAQFLFQTSTDSGSNYNTTITSTFFYAYHFESGSPTALAYDTNMDQAQGTSFQRIVDAIGSEADESMSGKLNIFNPSSTTFVKHYMSQCNSYVDGTYTTRYMGAGYYNTTSAIDAVQFKMSSGNIDSGDIILYGVN